MKKLIALILILVISSFIIVSKDGEPLTNKIAKENSENPNSKNKYWEYVKDRLFDGETENVFKRKGVILISLSNATKEDSLIVNEIINELRIIIPNRKIDYFNNVTGESIEGFKKTAFNNAKYSEIEVLELIKSTTVLVFSNSSKAEFQLLNGDNYRLPNNWGTISGTNTSRYLYESFEPFSCYFYFRKQISLEQRKKYIQYAFLRTLCYINPSKQYPIDYNRNGIFESSDYLPENAILNQFDKFLLQKLYSDDFNAQFWEYMFANYPWRYASSFVNKNEYDYKVLWIPVVLGISVFVLMFSYFQNRTYKYVFLYYWFLIFLILIHLFNLINIYQYLTKFNSVIGWKSHIFFQFLLAILLSVSTSFILWSLEKMTLKKSQSFSYLWVLKVSYTFVAFIFPMVLFVVLNRGLKGVSEAFFFYLIIVIGLTIGRGILLYLNHYSESLVKEKDFELSRLKEAKAEAEFKTLQSQINPHFLYNALNSIASLAHTDADKTEKMALSLSDLFRHSINRKGKKVNTLGDELSLVQNYLEIEQIRFGDRLKFSIDVDADLLNVEIPKFILQPLVENAIKHGISKIESQGKIVLKVCKVENGVMISVQDNGPDFPEGLVSGHGLQTVYDLLKFSYGEKSEMSWHNEPQKEIIIRITAIL